MRKHLSGLVKKLKAGNTRFFQFIYGSVVISLSKENIERLETLSKDQRELAIKKMSIIIKIFGVISLLNIFFLAFLFGFLEKEGLYRPEMILAYFAVLAIFVFEQIMVSRFSYLKDLHEKMTRDESLGDDNNLDQSDYNMDDYMDSDEGLDQYISEEDLRSDEIEEQPLDVKDKETFAEEYHSYDNQKIIDEQASGVYSRYIHNGVNWRVAIIGGYRGDVPDEVKIYLEDFHPSTHDSLEASYPGQIVAIKEKSQST